VFTHDPRKRRAKSTLIKNHGEAALNFDPAIENGQGVKVRVRYLIAAPESGGNLRFILWSREEMYW
jgi:hypothetical protein